MVVFLLLSSQQLCTDTWRERERKKENEKDKRKRKRTHNEYRKLDYFYRFVGMYVFTCAVHILTVWMCALHTRFKGIELNWIRTTSSTLATPAFRIYPCTWSAVPSLSLLRFNKHTLAVQYTHSRTSIHRQQRGLCIKRAHGSRVLCVRIREKNALSFNLHSHSHVQWIWFS